MAIYSKSDLGIEGNDGTTLEQYIKSSESRFGLPKTNLETISDERLTSYVQYIDRLNDRGRSWNDSLEDRKEW